MVVTAEIPGPALVYATDTKATPSTATVIIAKGKSSGTITLNDASLDYVKITAYANRKSSTCSAIPG